MKWKWNPIVRKDLQVTARSMRISWGLFAYEALLALAFLLALGMIQGADYSREGNIYKYLIYLFPVVAVSQVCIVTLVVPILTASSISGERERQTLDLMLTTCMSPFSIVWGKVLSAVIRMLFFVAGSLPIMAVSFVAGGLGWSSLLYFVLAIILQSLFSGSIGIFCSTVCRKSISAVLLSFVLYFVFYGMTFLPLLILAILGADSTGESLLFLLVNPAVFFEEFFMRIMEGRTMLWHSGGLLGLGRDEMGPLTYLVTYENVWVFVSAGCLLILSFLLLRLAAWRLNPLCAPGNSSAVK